ncbi:trigger factor [Tessaracoccus rhinocerotis]|uniref:Trigger factor n=1 Tax=Tessaracoccus rhinocerotis TaxID=1689449 RepID=A0A553K4L4_9ACTN|nr:trigger factor [Tessaracoccus rhinocerotis]TRY19648.1 trigger factor [Tessaracoccus rhinocerotis]
MPSTLEQLSPTRVKLTVEIPFADLKPHLDKAYKEIAEQVTIPGFRKGKVPAAVIDQRFGRGVVLQEAINEALPDAYQNAVVESNIKPMGQPDVDVTKLEDNELIEFTAEVDVRPEFELPELSSVEATVEKVETGEEAVDERIELLRQRFATNTVVDRPAKDGDVLSISLVASQNGEPLADATAEDVTYKIGDGNGMLEGLDEAVIGLSAGETKTFTSTLVGGAFRGQEAEIEVTVTKVQEQELPAVDDEFAQLVSEFDTVAEMREDLSKAVAQQGEAEQLADARDKVLEAIIAKTEFEVPEKLLSAELEARRQQIERQLANGGLSVEDYLETAEEEDAETPEEFWAAIDERSEQAVRAQIVLDKYADDNSLDVSQQELTELIFRKAQENRTTPQDEINHMMEHNHMGDWMQEIRRGKALAAMCLAATVKDSEGNVVEFPQPTSDEVDQIQQIVEQAEKSAADVAGESVVAADEPEEAPVEEAAEEPKAAKKKAAPKKKAAAKTEGE